MMRNIGSPSFDRLVRIDISLGLMKTHHLLSLGCFVLAAMLILVLRLYQQAQNRALH